MNKANGVACQIILGLAEGLSHKFANSEKTCSERIVAIC